MLSVQTASRSDLPRCEGRMSVSRLLGAGGLPPLNRIMIIMFIIITLTMKLTWQLMALYMRRRSFTASPVWMIRSVYGNSPTPCHVDGVIPNRQSTPVRHMNRHGNKNKPNHIISTLDRVCGQLLRRATHCSIEHSSHIPYSLQLQPCNEPVNRNVHERHVHERQACKTVKRGRHGILGGEQECMKASEKVRQINQSSRSCHAIKGNDWSLKFEAWAVLPCINCSGSSKGGIWEVVRVRNSERGLRLRMDYEDEDLTGIQGGGEIRPKTPVHTLDQIDHGTWTRRFALSLQHRVKKSKQMTCAMR